MEPLFSDHLDSRTQKGETSLDLKCEKFEVKKGKALIVVNSSFNSLERDGNKNDMSKLTMTLTRMGFHVMVLENSEDRRRRNSTTYKKEVEYTINEWSSNKDGILNDADCLIVAFLSHGGQDKVTKEEYVVIDSETILTRWIHESFANNRCNALCGKPKLFIYRHCRGNKTDFGTEVTYKARSDAVPFTSVANMSEFFIAHPSYEGYMTFLMEEGSWFIQILVDVLEEMIPKGEELHHIMLEVNGRVQQLYHEQNRKTADGIEEKNIIKEAPVFKSSLTKKVYFQLIDD